jgi:WD40 repeat protein
MAAGPSRGVFAVSFMPGGRLAAASSDDSATIWNVADPRAPVRGHPPFTAPGPHAAVVGTGATSPDGTLLALGTRTGPVQLWHVGTDPPVLRATLTGPADLIEFVAFSPDGRHIAAGSDDGRAWLWDVQNWKGSGRPLIGHTNYVYFVAFSPDGRTLATASVDNTGRLWNISDPANPAPLGDPFVTLDNYVTSVAFSPNGRLLAVGGADSTVRLFDATDPANPRSIGAPWSGPNGYVLTLTFSADSRTLVVGGGDGTLGLLDVSNPAQPERIATLNASGAGIYSVDFDPERPTLLASAGLDKIVRLWETEPDRVADHICATVGDPVTEAEWARYVPGTPLASPCPGVRH